MWITVWTLIGTASTLENESPFLSSLVDLFQRLGPLFSVFGAVAVLTGFLIPMLLLWPKSKKNKESVTCYVEINSPAQFMRINLHQFSKNTLKK